MTNGMGTLAEKTAKEIDERFAAREKQLLAETTLDWDQLRPQVTSEEEYEALMKEVKAATKKNESLGQLVARLNNLGSGGIELANKVKKFILT